MSTKRIIVLAAIVLILSACGQPDRFGAVTTNQPTQTPQTSDSGIAQLLSAGSRNTTIEVDVYTWIPYVPRQNQPPIHSDMRTCPIFNINGVLLTDKPVPGFLRVLSSGHTNSTIDYPSDAKAWLIPVFTGGGASTFPYHARVRGHIGDPAFATCDRANHIFVVEEVVNVYEQSGPSEASRRLLPADYTTWPRYHDANLGYSFAYPAGWQVSPLQDSNVVAAVTVRAPEWPDYPVEVRIYAGETHYDQYQPAALPPLLQGKGRSILLQDALFGDKAIAKQKLTGYHVFVDDSGRAIREAAALFSGSGYTYELMLRYPSGFDAQQALLDAYTALVAGFELDVPPGPSPTPPIKQQLGAGPFLDQIQVVQQAQQANGSELTLVSAKLIGEAQARNEQVECATFVGHPDGVWFLMLYGPIKNADGDKTLPGTINLLYDAKTGAFLCGVVLELDPTPIVPIATVEPTSIPTPILPPYPGPTVTN